MEKNGIAYCASDFARGACKDRTVYAKPVFASGNTAQEQIPLADIYDHPDYIDIISAQEFELEGLFPRRFLLCILVAQTPEALDDMEQMILGCHFDKELAACAKQEEHTLVCRDGGCEYTAVLTDSISALLHDLAKQKASMAACLAAATEWCVGYPLQLFLPRELM